MPDRCDIFTACRVCRLESVILHSVFFLFHRNLELMGLAKKRKGWKFQYPTREFYHRFVPEQLRFRVYFSSCNINIKTCFMQRHCTELHCVIELDLEHFIATTFRLVFLRRNRDIEGYVEHSSGNTVVSASSNEVAIAKHLYRYVVLHVYHGNIQIKHNGNLLSQYCKTSFLLLLPYLGG